MASKGKKSRSKKAKKGGGKGPSKKVAEAKKGGRKRTSKSVDEAPPVDEATEEPKTNSDVVASAEEDENATVEDLDTALADVDAQGAVDQLIADATSLGDSGEDEGTTSTDRDMAPAGHGDEEDENATEDVEVFDLDASADGEDLEVVDLDADLAIEDPDEPPDQGPSPDEARDRLVAQAMALVEGEEEGGGPEGLDAIQRDTSLVDEDDDDEPLVDLGPTSTPEARARLLAAALAHAEMQEARYRVPMDARGVGRWKGTLALAIFVLAGFLAIAPPAMVVPEPPAQLMDADRLHGVRVTLLIQAQQIEAFRAREQRLPDSLDEVAAQLPGVRFVKSSNRLYQLVAYTPAGEAVVYDPAAPASEFAAIEVEWTNRRGS